MKKNRVVIYVDDALLEALKAKHVESGASTGEICRRLLRVGLFADQPRVEKRAVLVSK
jgi:hypothetical protein